jgi:hypothetical protein
MQWTYQAQMRQQIQRLLDVNTYRGTPLHHLILELDPAAVQRSLAQGANPMIQDSLGNTAMHLTLYLAYLIEELKSPQMFNPYLQKNLDSILQIMFVVGNVQHDMTSIRNNRGETVQDLFAQLHAFEATGQKMLGPVVKSYATDIPEAPTRGPLVDLYQSLYRLSDPELRALCASHGISHCDSYTRGQLLFILLDQVRPPPPDYPLVTTPPPIPEPFN